MVILVRHGRTEANARGLLLGRLDPELDELGVEQARALGERLAASTTSRLRIVTSPLRRTRATAHAIADALDAARGATVPVEVDERWIELDYGELDGRPLGEIPAEAWAQWRADPTFAPPGGESLVELGHRVRRAMVELQDADETDDVVVVSHVSPIKAAVAWALDVGDEVTWRLFLAPASITRIALRPTGPSLQLFNETAHLA